MAAVAGKTTIKGLFRQGWNEIPEVMGACCFAVFGITMGSYKIYKHCQIDGKDHKRFKMLYVVYRPNHPYVKYLNNRDTPEDLERLNADLKPYPSSPWN